MQQQVKSGKRNETRKTGNDKVCPRYIKKEVSVEVKNL